jgi:predicted ATP-binding protein involved in virulence
MDSPPIYLTEVELENFRCFSHLKLMLHKQLNVVVAPNGGGKTALLDAIAIAMWPFASKMVLRDSSVGFAPYDMRRIKSPFQTMQAVPPVTVNAKAMVESNGSSIEWRRYRKSASPKSRTSPKGAEPLQLAASDLWFQNLQFTKGETDEAPVYPVLAYYGTGRLWDQERLTWARTYHNRPDTSRESGYEDSLSPKSSYKSFVDWFGRFNYDASNERESGKKSPHRPTEKLNAVKTAVDRMLNPTGWHSLGWDFAEKRPNATHDVFGTLPVDTLSDGLRNTIGLASDIAHRCARLNPQFGEVAARFTPGVVLIDEIDMHLHPDWQQLILEALLDAFPLIQFIVTTHSPQVLTTAKRESIFILARDPEGKWQATHPPEETKGVESAYVLASTMAVNPVPQVKEAKWVNDYTALIDLGKHESTEGVALRKELDQLYGPTHPTILDLDRLIRFQSFRRKREQSEKS